MLNANQDFRSIVLTDENQEELRCSAIFRRDKGFLSYNRITLIGDRMRGIDLLRLSRGRVRFNLVEPKGEVGRGHTLKGEGFLTESGVSRSGPGLDDQSIYDVGELSIHEYLEEDELNGDDPITPHATFVFFQRPPGWPTPLLGNYWNGNIRRYGTHADRWSKPRGFEIKFRLATSYRHRETDELKFGVERFWLPAVEVEPAPKSTLSTEKFQKQSEQLWFLLKILIAFYFKHQVQLIERWELWPSRNVRRYWPERLSQIRRDRRDDPPFRGLSEATFFSNAIAAITKRNLSVELLHGAIYSYTSALAQNSLEGSITSYVEGIERLLEIFERHEDLTRQVLTDSGQIKAYRKATKETVDRLSFLEGSQSDIKRKRGAIRFYLRGVPVLTLQDGIQRMRKHFSKNFAPHEARLFNEIDNFTKTRSQIVHGKVVTDINLLHAESVRGQALFEKLFLCLVGCPKLEISKSAEILLDSHT